MDQDPMIAMFESLNQLMPHNVLAALIVGGQEYNGVEEPKETPEERARREVRERTTARGMQIGDVIIEIAKMRPLIYTQAPGYTTRIARAEAMARGRGCGPAVY